MRRRSRRVLTGRAAVSPELTQEVERVFSPRAVGGRSVSVVVTAYIRQGALLRAMDLLRRRYDNRAHHEEIPFDRAALERVDETTPLQIVNIGDYERLVLIRAEDGWDFCLTSIGQLTDALILKRLLLAAAEGACAVTANIVASGELIT